MRFHCLKLFFCVGVVSSSLLSMSVTSAAAQDAMMKACGEKWQALKAANATNGATWSKFRVECRAAAGAPQSAAQSAPQGAAQSAPQGAAQSAPQGAAQVAPAASAVQASSPAAPASAPKAAASPVFPAAVSGKFSDLRPAQARQKTCSEQYQANKASGGNGGLSWLEKGGGYWSLCNKKLKGV